MRTICAWCLATMIDGPEPDNEVSHGICPSCLASYMANEHDYRLLIKLKELPK